MTIAVTRPKIESEMAVDSIKGTVRLRVLVELMTDMDPFHLQLDACLYFNHVLLYLPLRPGSGCPRALVLRCRSFNHLHVY